MEFCPKCSNLLKYKDERASCSCGHTSNVELTTKETTKQRLPELTVAETNENILAVHKHKCSHCGHDKAEEMSLGTWYSDEEAVTRYRCGKCSKVTQSHGKTT